MPLPGTPSASATRVNDPGGAYRTPIPVSNTPIAIEARLVNPPQRVKIGFLELPDSKRHAAIVSGRAQKRRPTSTASFFPFSALAQLLYKKYDFCQEARAPWGVSSHRRDCGEHAPGPLVCLVYPLNRRGRPTCSVGTGGMPRKGRVADLRWQASSSRLKATLLLSSRWFEDAHLTIRLLPRALPVSGLELLAQRRNAHFRSQYGIPPGLHLDVILIAGRAALERKTRVQKGRG